VPVVVDVAAPSNTVPFWIADQGFVAIGATLSNADTHWSLFRKSFPAGWVGLGVNGLDRTPRGRRRMPAIRDHPRRPRWIDSAPAAARTAALDTACLGTSLENACPLDGGCRSGRHHLRFRSGPRAGLELEDRARRPEHGHPDSAGPI